LNCKITVPRLNFLQVTFWLAFEIGNFNRSVTEGREERSSEDARKRGNEDKWKRGNTEKEQVQGEGEKTRGRRLCEFFVVVASIAVKLR